MNIQILKAAVAGDAAAIRSVARLEPAGGPGDKVFPPTFVPEKGAVKYALELRQVEGKQVETVLLDSVASQANRMEEALLEGWRRKELSFPLVQVDFSKETGLEDLEQISALQAPHRIADAILRDSVLGDTPFRRTEVGEAFTESRPNHATAMYKYCPTALIFGVWDSTGPKGGLGSKFQRCLVSEIVGYDVVVGVKVASRIDPLGIETKAGPIYQHKEEAEEWTTDEHVAVKKSGKPVAFQRRGAMGKGNPSAINHGNIPPGIDATAGGVTISHAVQTVVLSLPALRKLRFTETTRGEPIAPEKRQQTELAARTVLAALALCAIVYQRESDFDLRSRSLLVATEPFVLEFVGRNGEPAIEVSLDRKGAAELLDAALVEARQYGMEWDPAPITLTPAPKLAQLIRLSRQQVRSGEIDGGNE